MSSAAPYQLYMLVTTVLHPLFDDFFVHFRPSVPPKSRFSLERVVDFQVFRTFLPSTLLNSFASNFGPLWNSFSELWGPFWAPLDASWGALRSLLAPSSIILPQKRILKANFGTPKCPKSPQDTSRASQNRPKSTKIKQNQTKSIKINQNQAKSTKINQNLQKSTNIN